MSAEAKWTGTYPALCQGSWVLHVSGKDVTDKIPIELVDMPMNTFGKYKYYPEEGGKSETRKDGLKERIWIKENDEWLSNITTDDDLKKEIFKAFNDSDWRFHCCGGCASYEEDSHAI